MWPIRFLFAVGLLSLATPCSADLILTLTPTARVDFETQVLLTYTLTGRAGGPGSQQVGEFFFRVAPGSVPTGSNISLVFNPTIAQNGPWANPNFGTRGARIDNPANTNSRVTFDAFNADFGLSSPIDATGGVVGTFDITWNRPLTGQYDAAIPASAMIGSYALTTGNGPSGISPTITTSPGVSTVITAVPEPGSTVLMAIASCGMLWRHRRQLRKRQ